MKIAFISLGTLGPGSLHWTGQILSRGQHLLFYVLARNKTPPVNSRYKTFLFCYVICICYIVILHLHGSKRHLHCSLLFLSKEQMPQYFVSRQDKTSWSAQKSKSNVQNASEGKQQERIFSQFSDASIWNILDQMVILQNLIHIFSINIQNHLIWLLQILWIKNLSYITDHTTVGQSGIWDTSSLDLGPLTIALIMISETKDQKPSTYSGC